MGGRRTLALGAACVTFFGVLPPAAAHTYNGPTALVEQPAGSWKGTTKFIEPGLQGNGGGYAIWHFNWVCTGTQGAPPYEDIQTFERDLDNQTGLPRTPWGGGGRYTGGIGCNNGINEAPFHQGASSNGVDWDLVEIKIVGASTGNVYMRAKNTLLGEPAAAPSDLHATDQRPPSVALSWQDNSSDEHRFEIQRSPEAVDQWQTIATPDANVNYYDDPTPDQLADYKYRVRSIKADIPSDWSNVASTAVTGLPSEQIEGCDLSEDGPHPVHCEADPVNTATGSFTTSVTDLSLPGIGVPFTFRRSYSSRNVAAGSLGPGWTHEYAASLDVKTNEDVVLLNGNGQRFSYARKENCDLQTPPGGSSALATVGGASGYRSEVIADGPVGYWRLGETSGTSALDETTSGSTGSFTGTHTLGQPGIGASDAAVDIQGGHVSLGSPAVLKIGTPWSLEAWVHPTQNPDNGSALITEGFEGDGRIRYSLGYGDGAGNRFWVGFYNGGWARAVDTSEVQLNRWTHYIGTYDGNALKLYRDGDLVSTQATTAGTPQGNENFFIGRRWDSSASVRGRIDEVAVYDKALSASRVQAHFRASTCRGSGYVLTNRNQLRYFFDNAGRLTEIKDRNGNQLGLSYGASGNIDTLTDSAGRVITLSHNGDGRLTRVALPDGRSVSYDYTDGHLSAVTDARGNMTSYAYDAAGRLADIIDQNDHTVVHNVYGTDGRIESQTNARGDTSTFAWDETTQTSTMTDARGNDWVDDYSNNVLVRRIDPLGNTTSYRYDDSYNLTSVTDARGKTTRMTYDDRGNLLTRTSPAPLSYEETFTYNARNDLVAYVDGRGNSTSLEYDDAGNLVKVIRPGAVTTEILRDPVRPALVTAVRDALGKTTTFDHDALGNLVKVISPAGSITTMTYDTSGRVTGITDPRGNEIGSDPLAYTTKLEYDGANHVVERTSPLGNVTTWSYDQAGNLAAVTDAKGRQTAYAYDEANNMKMVTAPDSTATSYEYDASGNLTRREDANGHATTYTHDAANRLQSSTSPTNRTWTFDYDPVGNLTGITDARGNSTADHDDGKTSYSYDAQGRVTGIDYSDQTPDVGFSYDANSNRISMTDGEGTQTAVYDALDRLQSVSRGTDSFSYVYDAASNITRRAYPGGDAIDYTYAPDGRLASANSDNATTTYTYDMGGNLIRTDLPAGNGYSETRTYDRDGRLIEIVNRNATTVLSKASYVRDAVGNPSSVVTQDGTSTFAYDSLDRLTEACFPPGCDVLLNPLFVRYEYDAVGNRLKEIRPGEAITYAYNAADQLVSTTSALKTTTFEHDANGNMTRSGETTFSYDLANRLTSTTTGAQTTTYSYDGDGTRVKASAGGSGVTTRFAWDPNYPLPMLASESDGNGDLLRRYVYGNDLVSMTGGSSASYYHYDGLGSVTNVTSAGGTPQWSYSYEPFGASRSALRLDPLAPDNPMRFTGEYQDPTGLYHLRARQYDSLLGRLLQTEPLPSLNVDPYVSAYVYVNNRPTLYVDPSGLLCILGSNPDGSCRGSGVVDAVGDAAVATGRFVRDVACRSSVQDFADFYSAANFPTFGNLITSGSFAVGKRIGASNPASLAGKILTKGSLYLTAGATVVDVLCKPFDK